MELKIERVFQQRAYVETESDDHIVVRTTADPSIRVMVPKKVVTEGAGIISRPCLVFTGGWHGWLYGYTDGTYGFLPDSGGPI